MAKYLSNEIMDILLTFGECNRNFVLPIIMLNYILIVVIHVLNKWILKEEFTEIYYIVRDK